MLTLEARRIFCQCIHKTIMSLLPTRPRKIARYSKKPEINSIVSAARSLTCRDDLDSKWRLLLAENELSRVSLLSRISIEN